MKRDKRSIAKRWMKEKQYKESDKNRADELVKYFIGYQLCFAFVIRLFARQLQHDFRFPICSGYHFVFVL